VKAVWPLFLSLVAGTALAGGVYWGISRGGAGGMPHGEAAALVDVEAVKIAKFEERTEALGTVKARESVTLTSTVTELVDKIYFQEGQQVKKGELLVSLEQTEEQAALHQAELSVAEENRLYLISKRLYEKRAVAQTDYEKQLYAHRLAVSKYDSALASVQKRNITAPFAGQVGIRQVSPGTLVSPGTAITTLDDLTVVKVSFTLPEVFLAGIRQGEAVEARCAAYPSRRFHGRVTVIDSRVDSETRAVTILAEFANADGVLRPGMLMSLDVIGSSRQSPALPEKALLAYGTRHYVFVVKPDRTVVKTAVEIGQRNFGTAEVLSGVKTGDLVVSEGVGKIVDGQKVTLNPTSSPVQAVGTDKVSAGPSRQS